ncbi:hypothetical protein QBC38DRAFT_162634 [Podospora fimiseda]|uniref:Uncharacterized protein n=1 Tax=Podospora fimiseda TaxID=252190 RepID=A0AAN7H3L9_9PEZI|nr:hypothetical protein QBC38DRAFT_162634 [Podospora fimiseda]
MASRILHKRDGDESSNASLSSGAIAGIACGTVALFVVAAILFFLYWRRDRRFDRQDNFYQARYGLDHTFQPTTGMMPNSVSYTMDYKMDSQQKDHDGSSYTYSPDKPTYPFSPLSVSDGGGASSAMPTHPAYIPRAFVRGVLSSNHSRTTSTSTHNHHPHQILPSNTISSSPNFSHKINNNNNSPPNDMLVQAYLDTASGERVPSAVLLAAASPPSNSQPLFPPPTKPRPAATTFLIPTQITPSQIIPLQPSPGYSSTSSSSLSQPQPRRKPRQYTPPRLNLVSSVSSTSHTAIPLKGKENSTISGPLAFPQHYCLPTSKTKKKERRRTLFAEDDDELSECDEDEDEEIISDRDEQVSEDDDYDERANRRRQLQEEKERAAQKMLEKEKAGRRQLGMNNNTRRYDEVEIGRDSDIW